MTRIIPGVTQIDFYSPNLPAQFSGTRVLHLSDLHNRSFGESQQTLVQQTRTLSPDLILFTGDMIDHRRTRTAPLLSYTSQIANIAPVYYVPGNHEQKVSSFESFAEKMSGLGVRMLIDRVETIQKNGVEIAVIGAGNPAVCSTETFEASVGNQIRSCKALFKMLLAHQPKMQLFSGYPVDLVFSGHAHGGQFRLPLIGGLYAPDQGLFPKYTSGLYTKNGVSMVVSRGLGNSLFPFRICNRPELVLVRLLRAAS